MCFYLTSFHLGKYQQAWLSVPRIVFFSDNANSLRTPIDQID